MLTIGIGIRDHQWGLQDMKFLLRLWAFAQRTQSR